MNELNYAKALESIELLSGVRFTDILKEIDRHRRRGGGKVKVISLPLSMTLLGANVILSTKVDTVRINGGLK